MKFSEQIQDGDIDYDRLKSSDLMVDMDYFFSELVDELKLLPNDLKINDIERNFLATLKLLKKYEKKHLSLIPRSKIFGLYELPCFLQHQSSLQDTFDRKYPNFAQTCKMTVVAHRAFVPYCHSIKTSFVLRYVPDWVEIDVCLCKSGEVILQHDRYASSGVPIENAEIGELKDPVLLRDLIQGLMNQRSFDDKNSSPKLMIDVKGSASSGMIIDKIISILTDACFPPEEILLASFNMHYLSYVYYVYNTYNIALITANTAIDYYIPFMQSLNINRIIIDENSASKDLITFYSKHGVETWVYTVNEKGRLSSIADMHAGGVITDYPNLLL